MQAVRCCDLRLNVFMGFIYYFSVLVVIVVGVVPVVKHFNALIRQNYVHSQSHRCKRWRISVSALYNEKLT